MKRILFLLILSAFTLLSCSPIAKNTIHKKVSDSLSIGVDEYKKGNYNNAKLIFESALSDAYSVDNVEDQLSVLQNLTEINLRLEKYDDASNYIFTAKLIAERENEAGYGLYLTLGKYFDKIQDYALAQEYYRKAVSSTKKDEELSVVWQNIAVSKLRQNQLDDSENYVEKSKKINEAKKLNGALADNYFIMGEIRSMKNDFDGALTNYLAALNLDKLTEKSPGILDDLRRIAFCYQKKGDIKSAVYYYQKALNTARSLRFKKDAEELQKSIDSINRL